MYEFQASFREEHPDSSTPPGPPGSLAPSEHEFELEVIVRGEKAEHVRAAGKRVAEAMLAASETLYAPPF